METTLHRQLKKLYGVDNAAREVRLGDYRIDAVAEDLLIEVQVASLAAIRRKVIDLVRHHPLLVVKPVVMRSYIVRKKSARGEILGARYSPTIHHRCELFLDFVHFAKVFPRKNLSLEVLWIEQEEHRVPRRTWRRGQNYRVVDRRLRSVIERETLTTALDLLRFLPPTLPMPFTTADLSRHAGIPRWLAQKVTYSLRWAEAISVVGKQRNSVVYDVARKRSRAA